MLGAAAGDAGTSARGASGREALTAPALPESRAGRRRSPRVWRLWHTLLTSAPLSCRSFAWRWSLLVSVLCVTCHREIKTTGRGAGTGPTELGRRRPHSLPRSRSSADRRLRGQTRRGSSVFAVRFGLSWELSFVTSDNTLSGLRRPEGACAAGVPSQADTSHTWRLPRPALRGVCRKGIQSLGVSSGLVSAGKVPVQEDLHSVTDGGPSLQVSRSGGGAETPAVPYRSRHL